MPFEWLKRSSQGNTPMCQWSQNSHPCNCFLVCKKHISLTESEKIWTSQTCYKISNRGLDIKGSFLLGLVFARYYEPCCCFCPIPNTHRRISKKTSLNFHPKIFWRRKMRGDPVYNETRMEIKDKERKRKQRRKMSFMFNYKTWNIYSNLSSKHNKLTC